MKTLARITEQQKEQINGLLIERYFTQSDANRLSRRIGHLAGKEIEYFLRLDNIGGMSEIVADGLIAALQKAPTKQESEEREAKRIEHTLNREKMIEWARDHGLGVKFNARTSDIQEAIIDAGLKLPDDF
jgi:hypothetical protein